MKKLNKPSKISRIKKESKVNKISKVNKANKISKMIGIFFVIIGILFASFEIKVLADIIIEPNNDFYEAHREDCEYVRRTYIANSKDGYVSLYTSPESKTMLSSVENGTQVFITYTYEDEIGVTWGVVMDRAFFESARGEAAWMNLDACYVKYDHISFMEDHQNERIQKEISFDFSVYKKNVILWTYPESGEIAFEIDPATDYAKDYETKFHSYYEDNKHRKWIRINYFMKSEGWICVSKPTNTKIKEVIQENKEPEIIYPSAELDARSKSYDEIIVALVLTISLIVITVIVIHKVYKK